MSFLDRLRLRSETRIKRMRGLCKDMWFDPELMDYRTCIRKASHNLTIGKHYDGEKYWGEEDHT